VPDKEKGDPFDGIALESTGVVLGGDKQEIHLARSAIGADVPLRN
jgi:hypothetical protein